MPEPTLPEFSPCCEHRCHARREKMSGGAVAGIVAACLFAAAVLSFIFYYSEKWQHEEKMARIAAGTAAFHATALDIVGLVVLMAGACVILLSFFGTFSVHKDDCCEKDDACCKAE